MIQRAFDSEVGFAMGERSVWPARLMLWIDAVGGYWVALGDDLVLGQPVVGGGADIPILGDISGRHARLRRDGEGYLLEPLRTVYVNGRRLERAAALADGARIQLGDKVRLVFRQPHPLSATARLDFASGHRTQPPADAVLLMADSCILGPGPQCHVVCRPWTQEVVLYRHGDGLFCRAAGPCEIDRQGGDKSPDRPPTRDSAAVVGNRWAYPLLPAGCRVNGEGFSFSLEALHL